MCMLLLLKQKADTLIMLLLLGNKSLPHLFMVFSIASPGFIAALLLKAASCIWLTLSLPAEGPYKWQLRAVSCGDLNYAFSFPCLSDTVHLLSCNTPAF